MSSLCLGVMFCWYLLGPFEIPLFLCLMFVRMTCLLVRMEYWNSPLFLWGLICGFRSNISFYGIGYLCLRGVNVYNCNILLVNCSPNEYDVTFLILIEFGLKSKFFQNSDSYTSLFLSPFSWNTPFHSFTLRWCILLKVRYIF